MTAPRSVPVRRTAAVPRGRTAGSGISARLAPAVALASLFLVAVPAPGGAQGRLLVRHEGGHVDSLRTESPRGYEVLPIGALETLGWTFESAPDGVELRSVDCLVVASAASPLARYSDITDRCVSRNLLISS